jgi:hypothetical protein
MDPDACFDRWVDAITDGDADIDDAIEAATDLVSWLDRGGFVPERAIEKPMMWANFKNFCYHYGIAE